jgi:asparagine synthase (glutamine-hydrolysing)
MERCLKQLVWHLEEPRVGQSYPNFYASHLASRFSKVVLAGTGGDELFGGYPWRYYRTIHSDTFGSYLDKYYVYWHRLVDNSTLWRLFAGIRSEVGHVWTHDIFRDVFDDRPDQLTPEDCINHSLYLEAKTFLHGLLVVEDKLSMAHGLETRLPFLDNDLVDFAMRLPVAHKVGNLDHLVALDENESAFQKQLVSTRDGKMLLRRMMRGYVPVEIADGVKQGFSAPDQSWFKGDSIDFVRDRLMPKSSPIYQWMDHKIATGLVEDHLSGRANRRLLIWSMLYLDEMCRAFFAPDAASKR